jgi:hypothetical protein
MRGDDAGRNTRVRDVDDEFTRGAIIRRLADLEVDTLALMHGPAFTGDCRAAPVDLAADFERRIGDLN